MNKNIRISVLILTCLSIILSLCSCNFKIPDKDAINSENAAQKKALIYLKSKYEKEFDYVTINYISPVEMSTDNPETYDNNSDENISVDTAQPTEQIQPDYNIVFCDKDKNMFNVLFQNSEIVGDSYCNVYYTKQIMNIIQDTMGERGVIELISPSPKTLTDEIDYNKSCKDINEYLSNRINTPIEFNIYTKDNPFKNIDKIEIGKTIGTFCDSGAFKINVLTFENDKYNEIRHEVLMGNQHDAYTETTKGFKSSFIFDTNSDKIIKTLFS